jgi:hypothetical protein
MVWGAQLTPEQQARLPEFVDKWTKIALSTAPVDRERAEWALIRFYHAAGLAEPRVVWLPCPMSAALSAIAYARVKTAGRERAVRGLRHRANFVEEVTDDLFFANHAARRPIRCAVEAALGSALRQAPHRDAGADLAAEFGGAAGAVRRAAFSVVLHPSLHQTMLTGITLPIARAVDGILRHTRIALEMVGRRVSSPVLRTAAAAWLGGSQSLTHAAQRDYADQILNVPMDRSFVETMASCGPYWTLAGVCFASERPLFVNRDAAGRLHGEVGPSMAYRSGWSWWHWHGLEVAQYMVEEPQRISLATIEGVNSPELRRILIDRYRDGEEIQGAAAYLRDAGATRLNHDPAFGTLWCRDLDRDEPIVMVEVVNRSPEPDGSFRRYFLRVDPRLRPIHDDGSLGEPQAYTARNAVASTFGLSGTEYAPNVET